MNVTSAPERRKFHRLVSRPAPCKIRIRNNRQDARIVDESIDGLRVSDLKLNGLHRGEKAEVEWDKEFIQGECRSISRNDDGTFRIGIQRPSATSRSDGHRQLLGHFIRFQQRWISCAIVETVGKLRRIKLFDGKEFTLDLNAIFQRTENERRENLGSSDELEETLQLYRLLNAKCPFSELDDLIEHEFNLQSDVEFMG